MTRMEGGVGDATRLGLVMSGRQALGTCRPRRARFAAVAARTARALWLPALTVVVLWYAVQLTVAR